MKGDLHLHSYYSDGMLPPAEVMKMAFRAGCDVTALTDHDTLDGVDEAMRAAREMSLAFLVGVEISAFDDVADMEVHILGYGVNRDDARFRAFISEQKGRRRARSEQLLERLAQHGMPVSADALQSPVRRELSRSHIAAALVKLGYESDFFTAMHKWLRFGAPTFVPMRGVSCERAIDEIHAAGGLAVLAHPVRLDLDRYGRRELIGRLCDAGLDGLEAVYKRSSHAVVKELKDLARSLGMFYTAGADYHGEGNEIIARKLDCEELLARAVLPG